MRERERERLIQTDKKTERKNEIRYIEREGWDGWIKRGIYG